MRRLTPVILVAAAVLLVAAPASACVKRHSVPIGSGNGPGGRDWEVEGTIGPEGSACHDWLLSMTFKVGGASWGFGTSIPADGHYAHVKEPQAFDALLEDGSDRVFLGFTNGETAKLVVTLSDAKQLVIRPRPVPAALVRKNAWLENLRYFVRFYPPVGFVTSFSSFDAAGHLVFQDESFGEEEDAYPGLDESVQ